jgi:uncharacterized protein YukE
MTTINWTPKLFAGLEKATIANNGTLEQLFEKAKEVATKLELI